MTKPNLNQSIAFIGGGNMARSIIGGLITAGWSKEKLFASDPLADQRDNLENDFGIKCFDDNNQCIEHADIVVFSVKPQMMKAVVQSSGPALVKKQPLLISIAAGIRMADILSWAGKTMAFIRVMPNTPALVNCGVSGLLANDLATDDQRNAAENIMRAVGEIVWVNNESDIDAVTGVSGSGPAYFFKLMEIMIASAGRHGLSNDAAKTLVLQTALGAAKLAVSSEHLPDILRKQVTSPGGTTEAAILKMEELGIDETVAQGVRAAVEKSDELAHDLGDQ